MSHDDPGARDRAWITPGEVLGTNVALSGVMQRTRGLTTRVDGWGLAFLGALGLAACGGTSEGGGGAGTGGTGQGGSGAGGSGAGGSGAGTSVTPYPCENPTPIEVEGQETGWVRCEGGFTHRAEKKACPSPGVSNFTCPESPEFSDCQTDADCTDRDFGRCGVGQFGAAGCYCSYGCETDADCGENQICECGERGGSCVSATCTSDADCPGDLMCTSYVQDPGCGGTAYACQTPNDECGGSPDCVSDSGFSECSVDQDGAHVCQQAACAIGRPFLVLGEERLAPIVARGDWGEERQPCVEALDPWTRSRLADHWTEAGLMEHASVAAFARFSLQLMSFGAPPELIEETNQAMVDETAHARACFALASAYAGKAIGPGPLDLSHAFQNQSLLEAVRLAIREGCVGETVAALEASEARARARDSAVCQVLDRVIGDETRHAALAWNFVRWALSQDSRVADLIRSELAVPVSGQILPSAESIDEVESASTALDEHGLVSSDVKNEIRRQVIEHVVFPGFRSLLANHAAAEAA